MILEELDNQVSDEANNFFLIEEDDTRIVVEDNFFSIPTLSIKVTSGVFEYFDEESKQWVEDFSVTMIYDEQENDIKNYLYYEQDPIVISVYNFLNGTSKNVKYTLDTIQHFEIEKASF